MPCVSEECNCNMLRECYRLSTHTCYFSFCWRQNQKMKVFFILWVSSCVLCSRRRCLHHGRLISIHVTLTDARTHFSSCLYKAQNTFRHLIREQCLAPAAGFFSMLIIPPVGPSVWQCWCCATVVRLEPDHTAPWEMRAALQACR